MPNPHRGEVVAEIGGAEYTFRFTINSLCEAEVALQVPWSKIEAELQGSPSVNTCRALFWAGLRDHHPDLTITDAGELLGQLGMQASGAVIAEALSKAFPEPEADKKARPRKAKG